MQQRRRMMKQKVSTCCVDLCFDVSPERVKTRVLCHWIVVDCSQVLVVQRF